MIQKLKESESNLKSQIADLSITLMDNHPRLKALRSQLGGIQQQMRQETAHILASIQTEAKVAKLREAELTQQFDAAKVDSARTSEQEVGLNALEREANAQRQLLETYLARYREAASRSGKNSSPADARVISKAIEPREAIFPKILPITIIAGLATLILSCMTVLLMELFSGRALKPAGALVPASPQAIPVSHPLRTVDAHPAPVVTGPEPEPEVVAAVADTGSDDTAVPVDYIPVGYAVAGEHDVIDAEGVGEGDYTIESVAHHLIDARIPVAFGLSPSGDDGSTAMVMLARAIAEAGRSVIVIDMTGSLLPTRLMAADRYLPGITDLLTGDAAFGETIHSDRLSDAHIVPRGRANLEEAMRGADRLSIILGALSDAYNVVLVDCGPADVVGLARLTRNTSEHIILSMPKPDEAALTGLINACAQAGYADLMLMSDPRAEAPKGWFARAKRGAAA